MSSESATAPTPFHIWVAPYERGGRYIRGHWRPRSGYATEARAWEEAHGGVVTVEDHDAGAYAIPAIDVRRENDGYDDERIDERDLPRPLPQRGSQLPPHQIGQSLASDEPPIGEILAQLGVDRSEGRRWRRAGKHPALRWHRRYEGELAEV